MVKSNDSFAIKVKRVRERLCLTQEALAETLGVSFATVNRWENGHTGPSQLAQRQFEQLCKDNHIKTVTKPK